MKNPFAHLSFRARAEDTKPDEEQAEDTKPEDEKAEEDKPDGEQAEDTNPDDGEQDEEDEDGAPLAGKPAAYRSAFRAGAARERKRWGATLSARAAAGNLPLACHLLTTTTLSAKAVLGAVAASAPPAPARAGDRLSRASLALMDAAAQPAIGTGGGDGSPGDKAAAAILAAMGRKP